MSATIIQFPRKAPAFATQPCRHCGTPIVVGGWTVCSQACWDAYSAYQDQLAAKWQAEHAAEVQA